jgi:hypothetical protein
MKKTIFFLAMLFVSATVWAYEPPVYLTGQNEPAAMGVFEVEDAVEIDGVHYAVGSTQSAGSSDTVIPTGKAPVYLDGNDEPAASTSVSPPTPKGGKEAEALSAVNCGLWAVKNEFVFS